MWVWHTTLIDSGGASVIEFAKTHELNTIYLQASTTIPTATYETFIGAASAQGIRVVATSGAPAWALAVNLSQLTGFVNWASAYNSSAPFQDRFRSINLDIEGYLVPSWATDQASVTSQWMSNIQTAMTDGAAHGLPVSVDIPFWLDSVPAPGANEPLGRWLAQHSSQLVIMAYRNSVTGVLTVASAELADAATVGRPAVLAIDTTDSGPTTSFYGSTQLVVGQVLQQISAALSTGSGFEGWAVNDYEAWSVMPPG